MTRAILVAFDGTGRRWKHGTNIVRMCRIAESAGDGTIYVPGVRAGVSGWDFNRRLLGAYRALSERWTPGVRLNVAGYSRGGAAAIAFCNVLAAIGVSPAAGLAAREGFGVYGARPGYAGVRRLAFMDATRAVIPFVDRLLLFDPVSALGFPLPHRLARVGFGQHEFGVPTTVRRYIAILAADERRWHFRPIVQTENATTVVRQVWMRGSHADIGGSGPLADVALRAITARPPAGWRRPRRTKYDARDRATAMRWPFSWLPRASRPVGRGIGASWLEGKDQG